MGEWIILVGDGESMALGVRRGEFFCPVHGMFRVFGGGIVVFMLKDFKDVYVNLVPDVGDDGAVKELVCDCVRESCAAVGAWLSFSGGE